MMLNKNTSESLFCLTVQYLIIISHVRHCSLLMLFPPVFNGQVITCSPGICRRSVRAESSSLEHTPCRDDSGPEVSVVQLQWRHLWLYALKHSRACDHKLERRGWICYGSDRWLTTVRFIRAVSAVFCSVTHTWAGHTRSCATLKLTAGTRICIVTTALSFLHVIMLI